MLRKILIGLFLLTAGNTYAQNKASVPSKTTAEAIDYKQMGAPMPDILVLACRDTTTKKDTAVHEQKVVKRKRRHEKPEPFTPQGPVEFINNKTLKSDGNLFIMMFNPTCGHCDAMATLIEENIGLFKRSKILLLANQQMLSYLPDFAQKHHIQYHKAMYIGTDSSGFIDNVFLYQALPQINIYDTERKLIKTYSGETPFNSLKRYIQ